MLDKFTLKPVTAVALANAATIDEAARLAHAAAPACRRMAPFVKKQILLAVASEVRERFDEFAGVLCVEAGKPIAASRVEVNRLIDTFTIAAEESVRIRGEWETLEISPRSQNYEVRVAARCVSKRKPAPHHPKRVVADEALSDRSRLDDCAV